MLTVYLSGRQTFRGMNLISCAWCTGPHAQRNSAVMPPYKIHWPIMHHLFNVVLLMLKNFKAVECSDQVLYNKCPDLFMKLMILQWQFIFECWSRSVLFQFAVECVLKEGVVDSENVLLIGGSHGGFIGCHLIGQYPGFYKAFATRNPVINLASKLGTTDIPDQWVWKFPEIYMHFSYHISQYKWTYELLLLNFCSGDKLSLRASMHFHAFIFGELYSTPFNIAW